MRGLKLKFISFLYNFIIWTPRIHYFVKVLPNLFFFFFSYIITLPSTDPKSQFVESSVISSTTTQLPYSTTVMVDEIVDLLNDMLNG